MSDLLHVDEETNAHCIVGGNIQDVLSIEYQKVQKAAVQHQLQNDFLERINTEFIKSFEGYCANTSC
ncbi:hypothetical protein [Liquorilactobacillus uvarum]|uniref:hypothetical protein n=1 Tax=Liquorilactobacillus uvarum TaxID=303240 RepID=UPI00288B6B3E|nr:hypothetical protein [Liquorilactobacillus uvarum]